MTPERMILEPHPNLGPAGKGVFPDPQGRWTSPRCSRCPRYPGDVAEVKFFLAEYRHTLFRGSGIFIEFAESSDGSPAASAGVGFLFPYRVDPALLSGARAAAKACGIDGIRMLTLRLNSGGRIAMSRGFKTFTIFRMGTASSREESLSDERAADWAAEIAVPGGDVSARDDERGP